MLQGEQEKKYLEGAKSWALRSSVIRELIEKYSVVTEEIWGA
jgi:hypothetical protein